MKHMKKLIVAALAVVTAVALCVPAMAFAATITVNDAVDGKTYTAYKLLDATYEGDEIGEDAEVAYFYTGANTDELYTILAKYFQFEAFDNGVAYVKVVDADNQAIDYSGVDVAALAEEINTAMNRTSDPLDLTPAGSATADGGNAAIDGLDKGYYFIDTTTGSICSIGTTGGVEMFEKNSIPAVSDKQVKPDGADDSAYTDAISGTVGDKFNFKVTVNTGTNPNAPGDATGRDTDFVVTDTLGKGFTLATAPSAFEIEGWNYGTDFTVSTATADDGATVITITLKASKLATVDQDTNIDITYDATLNENAITDSASATNDADGEITKTYTYGFEVSKVNTGNEALEGVKFTLTNEDGDEYYFVPSDPDSVDEDVMRPLGDDEDGKIATASNGKITFSGLAAGTYTLTETDTLEGYNLLNAPIIVVITPNTDPATAAVSITSGAGEVGEGNVITIVNQSGTELPSTGGMGTTILYIVGGIMIAVAAVYLISRRRASKVNDSDDLM